MRIYSSCIDAAKEIERDLVEMGITNHPQTMQDIYVGHNKDYETKELVGYVYRIQNPGDSLEDWITYFKLNRQWLVNDFEERVSGKAINPGKAWELRKDTWAPFIHNGKFAYTYAERFYYQLKRVIRELDLRPATRQAIITVYEGRKDITKLGGIARVPCSLHYQFLRRDINGEDTLGIIYTMRSCDFYLHYAYDVALAIMLLHHIASILRVKPIFFQHQIGSLHAYAKDYSTRGIF